MGTFGFLKKFESSILWVGKLDKLEINIKEVLRLVAKGLQI